MVVGFVFSKNIIVTVFDKMDSYGALNCKKNWKLEVLKF